MTKPFASVLVVAAVALLLGVAGARPAPSQGPALIRVSQRVESRHFIGVHTVQTSWIRDRKARRIGWSVLYCTPLGAGAILGGAGSSACMGTYSFPLGRIQTAGVIRLSATSYVLAVTGGTGFYLGAGGALLVRDVGTSVELLLFSLST